MVATPEITHTVQKFYDDVFGDGALPRFIQVGRRRGNSAEYTLEALRIVYDKHTTDPFAQFNVMGQMVHATASKLRRERFKPEMEPWEIFAKLSKKRTFRDKFNNWMRWGKWE